MCKVKTLVVGTGFGGSVTACRLAQAGLAPMVLERGQRWARGEFPRDFTDFTGQWLWDVDRGLFDVRPMSEVQLVMAAGYGGGSLVYANVHLRAPEAVFEHGWPRGLDRAALEPYYDLVAHMLQIAPMTEQQLPVKAHRMRVVAAQLGRADQFFLPPLAVHFAGNGAPTHTVAGVELGACTQCGECDIGCNEGAKNTLDINYLAIAEREGAQVRTSAEVFCVTPLPEGGYAVDYHDLANGGDERVIADHVFLCAGAINTTELLLRCRDQYRTLPQLSDRLGKNYFANADAQSFVFDTDQDWEPTKGPVISTSLLYSRGEDPVDVWFMIEEGGYPEGLAGVMRMVGELTGGMGVRRRSLDELRSEIKSNCDTLAQSGQIGDEHPGDRRVACLLQMGRDLVGGQIELSLLDPSAKTLDIDWQVPENMAVYTAQERLAKDIADALGGRLVLNPMWEHLRVPVSVHNLGGCSMSDDSATGVTDPWGAVYHHPGLYVHDGAMMPQSLGINPASSIAAISERNIEHHIRALVGHPGWRAPERDAAPVFVDPVDAVLAKLPKDGSKQTQTPATGIRFRERMAGYLLPQPGRIDDEGDFHRAQRAARKQDASASLELNIFVNDLDRFIVDPSHRASATGTVHVPGLTPEGGAKVRNGQFNLFIDGERFYERQMRYILPFVGVDGHSGLGQMKPLSP